MDLTPADFAAARRGGFRINPDGREAAELRKHEQFPTYFTGPEGPGNPYKFRRFPAMVYRAQRHPATGKMLCLMPMPRPEEFYMSPNPNDALQRATDAAEKFNRSCYQEVKDERELQYAQENGWRDSPGEAVEAFVAKEAAIAEEAGVRAHADRNMSEAAKAEVLEEEAAAAPFHIPEIQEAPRRKSRER